MVVEEMDGIDTVSSKAMMMKEFMIVDVKTVS